jgi:hypothetical protein
MSHQVPFARSYWVEPARLLAGFFPGDSNQAAAAQKLGALLDCGVTHFVNLMEEHELNHAGQPFAPYAALVEQMAQARGQSVRCERFAIADRKVPKVALMSAILDSLDEARSRSEISYVHCWGGRGRTGTVVACHLRRREGLSAAAALDRLQALTADRRALFSPTPEVGAQRRFVEQWKEQS